MHKPNRSSCLCVFVFVLYLDLDLNLDLALDLTLLLNFICTLHSIFHAVHWHCPKSSPVVAVVVTLLMNSFTYSGCSITTTTTTTTMAMATLATPAILLTVKPVASGKHEAPSVFLYFVLLISHSMSGPAIERKPSQAISIRIGEKNGK